jgi:hypothetical protein
LQALFSEQTAIRRPWRTFLAALVSDESETCFVVKDNAGQKLAYVYFEDELLYSA